MTLNLPAVLWRSSCGIDFNLMVVFRSGRNGAFSQHFVDDHDAGTVDSTHSLVIVSPDTMRVALARYTVACSLAVS